MIKIRLTKRSRRLILLAILPLILAIIAMVVTGISVAQEGTGSSQPPGQSNSETFPAELPDLVVTDPEADITALIAEELDITTAVESVLVPAAAFTDDGVNSIYFFPFGGGYLYSTDSLSGYCGMAPVYLPDGATVSAFTAYAYDNTASTSVSVSLYAETYTTTSGDIFMAGVSTPANNTTLQAITDTTITNAIVDLDLYAYYAATCLGSGATSSNNRLYAVQVFYTR